MEIDMKVKIKKPLLPFAISKIGDCEKSLLKRYVRTLSTHSPIIYICFSCFLIAGLTAFDTFTIYSLISNLFNDDPRTCFITALAISAIIDFSPYLASKLFSKAAISNVEVRKGGRKLAIGFLCIAIGGYLIFLGLTLISLFRKGADIAQMGEFSSLIGVQQNNVIDYPSLLRACIPLATSTLAFLIGYDHDPRRKRIQELLKFRKKEAALLSYNRNLEDKLKHDLARFDVDIFDKEQSKLELKKICTLVKITLFETRSALASELGSAEAADHLLNDLNLSDEWFHLLESELDPDYSHPVNNYVPVLSLTPVAPPEKDSITI